MDMQAARPCSRRSRRLENMPEVYILCCCGGPMACPATALTRYDTLHILRELPTAAEHVLQLYSCSRARMQRGMHLQLILATTAVLARVSRPGMRPGAEASPRIACRPCAACNVHSACVLEARERVLAAAALQQGGHTGVQASENLQAAWLPRVQEPSYCSVCTCWGSRS